MNIKLNAVLSVLALSSALFAAEPAASAAPAATAPAAEKAPAAAPESAAPVPAAEAATPAAEPAAVQAPAEPVAEAAAEPVLPSADPAPEAVVEEAPAPMAVRDGAAPTPAPAAAEEPVAAPAPTETAPAQTKTVTKVVYQPVYTSEPTAVRNDYVPVKTVYIAQQSNGPDTLSFDELRGLIPMKTTFGIQGFIGSYSMMGEHSYYDDFEDYSGLSWRVGAFGIFPLSEYTVGVRVGALYEQSEASESAQNIKAKIKQSKIDVPVTFVFKAPRSRLMFEIGAEADIAIKDELRVTSGGTHSKLDMRDKDFRRPVDWNMVCGFSVGANQYVALDFRFDIGLSRLYDSDNSETMKILNVDELSTATFMLGLSVNLF